MLKIKAKKVKIKQVKRWIYFITKSGIATKASICDISAQAISAQHNQRRSKSAQKKNEPTLLYLALIKKKFVCKVNSFVFNDNSLHWEHDCIFALPLRLSVNHYYKQNSSAQSQ